MDWALEGRASPDVQLRWIFSEITPTSFHWRNQELADDGATWLTVQTMVAQRAQE